MRLQPFPALPLLAVLAGVALTGCGAHDDFEPGLKPGAEGITAVIHAYATAIAHGDGARACSLMSRTAQEKLIQRTGVPGSCLAGVAAISDALSDGASTALDDVQVTDISGEKTTNASATATISGAGADEATRALGGRRFTMTVADARWGVESTQP
jgi:hypothetical protein